VNLLLLAGAGVVAGAVNAAVGSGTLLTYPLLLASGLPPVVANGTNSLGVAPGGLSAAWVYRGELEGRSAQVRVMALTGCVGAVVGALLVIALPARVFEVVVPWLILSACALVLVQPTLQRWLRSRGIDPTSLPRRALIPVLLGIGVYAGYFGAAQGVILMAALGTMYDTDLQRSNAVKNIVGGLSNVLAAGVFALAGVVMWAPALALAVGATVGGLIGAPFARRLPEPVLRGLIVAVGLVAATVSIVRH
jgi:uncharacterized membrane protein YfcA